MKRLLLWSLGVNDNDRDNYQDDVIFITMIALYLIFQPRWKVNNEEDEGPSAPPADEEDDGERFGLMMMIVMISMIVMIVGTTKTIVTVMIYYNDH